LKLRRKERIWPQEIQVRQILDSFFLSFFGGVGSDLERKKKKKKKEKKKKINKKKNK